MSKLFKVITAEASVPMAPLVVALAVLMGCLSWVAWDTSDVKLCHVASEDSKMVGCPLDYRPSPSGNGGDWWYVR